MSFKFELYYTLFREESTRGNLHYHNFYEIVYYESGAGYTTIEGKKSHYTLGPFDTAEDGLVLAPPGPRPGTTPGPLELSESSSSGPR